MRKNHTPPVQCWLSCLHSWVHCGEKYGNYCSHAGFSLTKSIGVARSTNQNPYLYDNMHKVATKSKDNSSPKMRVNEISPWDLGSWVRSHRFMEVYSIFDAPLDGRANPLSWCMSENPHLLSRAYRVPINKVHRPQHSWIDHGRCNKIMSHVDKQLRYRRLCPCACTTGSFIEVLLKHAHV